VSELSGKDLSSAFDDLGEFEGEMMDFVISQWKSDPTVNHVFASGSRVLLSPYFLTVTTHKLVILSVLLNYCTYISCIAELPLFLHWTYFIYHPFSSFRSWIFPV
jgi:hypothetical protein